MSIPILLVAAEAARDRKAVDIIALDLRGKSDLCDFQLIATAMSDVQAQAITEAIEGSVKQQLTRQPSAVEGRSSGQWILLDYGSTIIHVFLQEVQAYYSLENIWPGSKIRSFEDLQGPTQGN